MVTYKTNFVDFNKNPVYMGDILRSLDNSYFEMVFDADLSEVLENCETKIHEKARKKDIELMTIIKSRLNDDSEYEI